MLLILFAKGRFTVLWNDFLDHFAFLLNVKRIKNVPSPDL